MALNSYFSTPYRGPAAVPTPRTGSGSALVNHVQNNPGSVPRAQTALNSTTTHGDFGTVMGGGQPRAGGATGVRTGTGGTIGWTGTQTMTARPNGAPGGGLYYPSMGMPTYAQDYWASAQGRLAGPTNSQTYFNNYRPSTIAQDWATSRQATGYGPSDIANRYASRQGQARPNALGGLLPELTSWSTSGNRSDQRMAERRQLGPDALDQRMAELQAMFSQPTETSGTLAYLSSMQPSARGDFLGEELGRANVSRFTGDAQDRITGQNTASAGVLGTLRDSDMGMNANSAQWRLALGNGAGGRFATDFAGADVGANARAAQGRIADGSTAGGQMLASMRAGQGDTGEFLAGFDPTQNAGLSDVYAMLASEGPTYEEDFYTSQVAGTNPAYEQLKNDFLRDARNDAAGRGGYASGRAVDMTQRGLSRLAADEFARRGDLAGKAGEARRARLGQTLEGASALDAALFGRQSLQAGLGLDRESIMAGLSTAGDDRYADLAMSRDQGELARAGILGDIAMNDDNLYTDLAMSRDQSNLARLGMMGDIAGREDSAYEALAMNRDATGMDRWNLLSGLAQSGDARALDLAGLRLTGAGQEDDARLARSGQLNAVATSLSGRDADRQAALDALAGNADSTDLARRGLAVNAAGTYDTNAASWERDIDALAGNADQAAFARQRAIDELVGAAGAEHREGIRIGGDLAGQADQSNLGVEDRLRLGAGGASTEAATAARDKFNAALGLGQLQAAITMAYDMAKIGALTNADLRALDAELAAAGMTPDQRRAMMAQFDGLVGAGISLWTGGALGGLGGAAAAAPAATGGTAHARAGKEWV